MARPNTRSPTPAGSSHSKRSRRDDYYSGDRSRSDRYRRERSRSPNYRYRDDRDRRRDRSVERRHDRRDDNSYRPSRREYSRERRRSRERSPVRDSRDRDYRRRDGSRDHEHRRRDDSRDRDSTRRRREESTDSRRNARRDRSPARARDTGKSSEASTPAPSNQTEEAKQAERRAKLEQWKAKFSAKQKEQQEKQGSTGTREILDAIDKKSTTASPAAESPRSPAPTAAADTSKPFAGKFDPKAIATKAIAKKAAAPSSNGTGALGGDIAVPVNAAAVKTPSVAPPAEKSTGKLKASGGNVSGFGFGSKPAPETEKAGNKRALDFEEEESTRKKLEKLPTPPLEETAAEADAAAPDDEVEDDNDVDMADGGTEEEVAAAARVAAERREERLQHEDQQETAANGDVPMEDAEQGAQEQAEEEDLDPLDAFMSNLQSSEVKKQSRPAKGKNEKREPIALYGDDDLQEAPKDLDAEDLLAISKQKKARGTLPTVDHSTMNYQPVRFAFYTEPLELAELDEEATAALRFELDGITAKGRNVPKPVREFAQCGLPLKILDVIRRLGFERPTPIQAQAIPAIMSGRDVVGVAKTGSGKTLSFLLPMLRHILDQDPLGTLDGPIGLILAPTRELATQIFKEAKPFVKALNLRAAVCGGGAPIKDQIAELKKGAEIMVATPGRLIELLTSNNGRVTNLARVTYVVLDEADRMFDMGFSPQIQKVMSNIRPKRQTVLFSATFPPKLQNSAEQQLNDPVTILVGGRANVPPEVTQVIEIVEDDKKFSRLLGILGEQYENDEDARTLIFVERQNTAETLLSKLLKKMYPCNSIHGAKDQQDRDSALSDFKSGANPILIATSVAARGLDVKQLKLVINFDVPNHLEDYVHRAGRTGRAGNKGTAITFIDPREGAQAKEVVKALKMSGQPVPAELEEVAKTGARFKANHGFKGVGLENLDRLRDSERKAQRKQFSVGDEEEEEEEEDEVVAPKIVKNTNTEFKPTEPLKGVPKGVDLDGPIVVHKTEVPASGGGKSNDPMERVRAAASKVDSRLTQRNQLRPGQPIDNKGPDAGAFHATLEINDFPQKARWAVTNRTNVAKILEATGTSITTKGNFYAPGKDPGEGEQPKLYILVEGDTEVVVQTAMRELMRLLKEGTLAAEQAETRAPTGKYSVV
ncbi:P-loop containing nucleoside triphosphate hydrolase protein [Phyllosticta citricarpa]|uniref:RNA helicase n=2 Tax=Phyllosticta TaxID=121621 RepID=A0ABR1LJU5_9PEZI